MKRLSGTDTPVVESSSTLFRIWLGSVFPYLVLSDGLREAPFTRIVEDQGMAATSSVAERPRWLDFCF